MVAQQPTTMPKDTPPPARTWTLLHLAAGTLALLRLAACFLPLPRLWGLDYPASLGTPAALAAAALLAAFALPQSRFAALRAAAWLQRPVARWFPRALLLAAIALALFLPVKTFFYGDGGLLIPLVHRSTLDAGFDPGLMLNLKSSPLAGLLLLGATTLVPTALAAFRLPMPATALYPFAALSVALLLALLAAGWSAPSPLRRSARLLVLLGSAGGILLAGYVEYYAVVYAALFVYLLAAERWLETRGRFLPVVAAYLAAVAAHYYALALLPSLLYLLLLRRGAAPAALSTARGFRRSLAALLGAGALASIAAAAAFPHSRIAMPLAPLTTPAGTQSYTLFSAAHLADALNILLLLVPLSLPVVAALLPRALQGAARDREPARFHLLGASCFAAFLFFANTSLGLARDWDLTAPLAVLGGIFALTLLERREREGGAMALFLGAATLAASLPWFALHLSPEASARRFEAVMQLDAASLYGDYAASGYEALRKHYQNSGDTTRELLLCRKKIEAVDYAQHYAELIGKSLVAAPGRPEAALAEQRWMLERLERRARALQGAGRASDYAISLRQIDSLAEALSLHTLINRSRERLGDAFERVADATRPAVRYPASRALLAYERGDYPAAVEGMQTALNTGFRDPRVYLVLGTSLGILRRYSEAFLVFEEGVRRFPDDGALLFTLAKYYLESGRHPELAEQYLLHCLDLQPSEQRQREIAALLDILRNGLPQQQPTDQQPTDQQPTDQQPTGQQQPDE